MGRVTTLQADPLHIDAAFDYARKEAFPKINAMPGSLGGVMGATDSTGEVGVMTAWKDRAALEASAAGIVEWRDGLLAVLQTTSASVELFEMAHMTNYEAGRSEDLWVRSTRAELPADDIDDLIACCRDRIAPLFANIPGARAGTLYVDRDHGMAWSTAAYHDHDALVAADDRAAALRDMLTADVPSMKVVGVGAMRCRLFGLRPD